MSPDAVPAGPPDPLAVGLRPTREADLGFVLRVEGDPANRPFIGSWSREEHRGAIAASDRQHWIVEAGGEPAGYLIALDLRAAGLGVHVKRLALARRGEGIGRRALEAFCRRAAVELAPPFVWLDVLEENHRARARYRACRFEERRLPPSELARWADAVGGIEAGSRILVREERA